MFKIKNNISPEAMQELFIENAYQHDIRQKRSWEMFNIRTVRYGTETIRNMGPKIWDMVPKETKDSTSLQEFKFKIKKWKPRNCTCSLCKTYVHDLGFVTTC